MKNKKNYSRIVILLILSILLIVPSQSAYAKTVNFNDYSLNQNSATTKVGQALNPSLGLGTNQTEYISNNKSYDWYIDQGYTGEYSDNNCGPSCTTMALKWINSNFTGTAEDARETYLENGNWWTTYDITNYFDLYSAKYNTINLNENSLKKSLQQGNIAILCIDTTYLPYNANSEQRVGRFYDYKGGHFIVIKGYRIVDGKTYFESYDSNNWGMYYKNGEEKGKDRYYLASDLMKAGNANWNYAIIVHSK
ncbi:hypothetical protein psyc5s11_19420 [Clostridium gelidum]|uniref:Peptidase C39-like domain-containing protein n=1 Tax=Clostridium gelidum TaxID=704125 RepID=A0ABM7TA65_9CLOT|nr:C39 family peptidase [Clostridium gelidum]BCZ45875.1 hypothetical protein psyc5s11_19420 [Clostridium gelidum]